MFPVVLPRSKAMQRLWVTCLWLPIFVGSTAVSGCVDLTRPDATGPDGSGSMSGGGSDGGTDAGTSRVLWDFERGSTNDFAFNQRGDSPAWILFNDGTSGTQQSVVESAPRQPLYPDNRALKLSAGGYTNWGSGIRGVILPNQGFFDASSYTGLSMNIRATGIDRIEIKVFDAQTVDMQLGGRCKACNAQWVVIQSVGTEWTAIARPFVDFQLWGKNDLDLMGVETSRLIYFEIIVSGNNVGELWIDDLTLYR
jgi:hypothetical protein